MAIMGNQLFIVANGVIYQRTGAGTYGSYNSDNTYSRLWAAKGRLIASDTSGVLYEIEPSSASAGS